MVFLTKQLLSRSLEKSGIPVEKRQDGSTLVWQRRYWEHTIRDDDDLNRHIDYIHESGKTRLGKARGRFTQRA